MNPWQSLRNEINGAVRSIRYDFAARKARRVMRQATVVLPVVTAQPAPARRRLALAVGAIVVPVVGFSGYVVTADSWGALFPGGGAPMGLPEVPARPGSPSPAVSPDPAYPRQRLIPATTRPGEHGGSGGGPARPAPTGTPPVPTPAPTCGCVTQSPSPAPTPTPSATVSPKPTASPTPSPPPTTSFTPGHSPGVRR